MGFPFLRSIISFSLGLFGGLTAFAQVADKETVRVTMTVNADGSHTSYQFDPANKRATAVTTEKDGKPRDTIRYELDERGRFASGIVSGPDGKFRFKSIYKYDEAGRLQEEAHLGKGDALINKLVYSYDPAGKPTGYTVLDGSGKVMGQSGPPNPSAPPKSK